MDFKKFPKIPRLNRDMLVLEKIDGTNAQVAIMYKALVEDKSEALVEFGDYLMYAGSRNRWLQPGKEDNFGFAKWVEENADALLNLGLGRHFGEWWGQGIQRNYGLKEKRFSLFNVSKYSEDRPECCDLVPILYHGPFGLDATNDMIEYLKAYGSMAAPGFLNPEGVVVFHVAAGQSFKVTCEKDEVPKALVK